LTARIVLSTWLPFVDRHPQSTRCRIQQRRTRVRYTTIGLAHHQRERPVINRNTARIRARAAEASPPVLHHAKRGDDLMMASHFFAATVALCIVAQAPIASAKSNEAGVKSAEAKRHVARQPHLRNHLARVARRRRSARQQTAHIQTAHDRGARHRPEHHLTARHIVRDVATRRATPHASEQSPRDFSGIASYYWEGSRVATGARFNPDGLTAAHRTLPFGTQLRVTDLVSNRSVVVTVNDRGPFVAGRVLDLSRGAARVLGMTERGVTRIKASVM
jgi:rare lipoprotein A